VRYGGCGGVSENKDQDNKRQHNDNNNEKRAHGWKRTISSSMTTNAAMSDFSVTQALTWFKAFHATSTQPCLCYGI